MGSFKYWIQDFLGKKTEVTPSDAIYSSLADRVAFKELAIYIAVSYIANTLSKCEFKVYKNGEEVEDELYYRLNVSPNYNQNSSQFINKFIEEYFYKGEAILVQNGNHLYCADGFQLKDGGANPLKEFVYTNVAFGTTTVNKDYLARDVIHIKLDNRRVKDLIDGLYRDYGEILAVAFKSYKRTNSEQYKLVNENPPVGDEAHRKKVEAATKQQLKNFLENDTVVFNENKGQRLEKMNTSGGNSSKDTSDVIAMRKEIFDIVAQAFKIPLSMMYGNITNMNEIVKVYLSICIDPIADMLSEELTRKCFTYDEWVAGCEVVVDTSCINHVDILEVGDGIEKAISSGSACIDEIRERLGKKPLGTDFGRQHFITKNFETIENMLTKVNEGGE